LIGIEKTTDQAHNGVWPHFGNGSAIYRDNGQADQTLSETALLTLANPAQAGPEVWTITIYQNYLGGGGGAHLLGDFSLGYTTDRTPTLSSTFICAGLPGLILASGGLLGWWRRRQKIA
jgi:hypothetical protein